MIAAKETVNLKWNSGADAVDNIYNKLLLIASAINFAALFNYLLMGFDDIRLLMTPIVVGVILLIAYFFNINDKKKISLIIGLMGPIPIIFYFSFTFPEVLLDALFYIPLAITSLIFIRNEYWKKATFLFFLILCLSFQAYEISYFKTHNLVISAAFQQVNEVIIFCIISYTFATIYLMAITFSIYTKELKAKENQLSESETLYRYMFDACYDGIDIAILDPRNPKKGVTYKNYKSQEIYGRTAEELTPKGAFLKYAPKEQPNGEKSETRYRKAIETIKEKQKAHFEWRLRHKNGHYIDTEMSIYKINLSESKAALCITIKDVTEKKQQEAIIREQLVELNAKNEELQKYISSNMELENFAYIASHDLQSPLRTIISFTQLLERSLLKTSTQEQKEYMQFIVAATQQMDRLQHALLAYSRVNSSKINIAPLNTATLIEEILLAIKSNIDEKQAIINLANLPSQIQADNIKIYQLFQNLIINALKFTKPQVQPIITIKGKDLNTHWQFSVSDNGIGIAPEYQEKIFLLFQRLHNNEEYKGTGIGLALCKKIVEQHGGRINVQSKTNNGCTFSFTIKKTRSI